MCNVQYGEFRSGFDKDKTDTRLVYYGLRYILEHHVARRWTMDDVRKADAFYRCVLPPAHSSTGPGMDPITNLFVMSMAGNICTQ